MEYQQTVGIAADDGKTAVATRWKSLRFLAGLHMP